MTIRQAVFEGVKQLENLETPFLDAVVLLSQVTGYSKEKLLASYPEEIPGETAGRYYKLLDLRLNGYPVSYIRQEKEFYSLEFSVGPGVLVPRPETEVLVDAVIDFARQNRNVKRVHDACTGSGCVAISIKHELPYLEVSASDISKEALSYFRHNSRNILGKELEYKRSDLLAEIHGLFDVIVANPPYLRSEQWAEMAGRKWPEPEIALNGGHDGLERYEDLIRQSAARLRPGGSLLLEADPSQFQSIQKLLLQNGFRNTILYIDLAGRERVIRAGTES